MYALNVQAHAHELHTVIILSADYHHFFLFATANNIGSGYLIMVITLISMEVVGKEDEDGNDKHDDVPCFFCRRIVADKHKTSRVIIIK